MTQYDNSNSTMECRDHSKNAARLKSLTSKINFSFLWSGKIFLIISTFIVLLYACNTETTEERNAIGRYNLTSITGLDGVTASSYDYNYVTLMKGGKYEIKNKINGIVSEQFGEWSLKEGTLTTKTSTGSTTVTEENTLENNVITFKINTRGLNLTMELTKEK